MQLLCVDDVLDCDLVLAGSLVITLGSSHCQAKGEIGAMGLSRANEEENVE